ncbi:MAG: acyltransferase [Phycisphaeraceae bacterium]
MTRTDTPSKAGPLYAKAQRLVTDPSESALRRYQRTIVGNLRLGYLVRFELLTLILRSLPGALGLLLRSKLYRGLFRSMRRGVVIGSGVILRSACRIDLGEKVVVSDGCILDGRGEGAGGITLQDGVILGDRVLLRCKQGEIRLGRHVGVGACAALYAVCGNRLEIGEGAMIGPFVYLGGTQYRHERTDLSISEQGPDPRGGITIGAGAWLGARATVLDGIRIGEGAIVAAGAVVTRDVPAGAVVAGVPARVVRDRSGGGG